MCDCADAIKEIKEAMERQAASRAAQDREFRKVLAALAYSQMQISGALQDILDREAASRRLEERRRVLRDGQSELAIIANEGTDPHDEDTKPNHVVPVRDTQPSPPLEPQEV